MPINLEATTTKKEVSTEKSSFRVEFLYSFLHLLFSPIEFFLDFKRECRRPHNTPTVREYKEKRESGDLNHGILSTIPKRIIIDDASLYAKKTLCMCKFFSFFFGGP